VAIVSAEKAAAMSDNELCSDYGNYRDSGWDYSAVLAEINKRHLIRDEARNAFLANQVAVGMTSLEAVCTWGDPDDINTTSTRYGTSHQLVYEEYHGQTLGSTFRYVYVEDGVVTAVQD
jgi:hypothetical protein